MDGKAVWHELLEYARWSPSPHNIQPWKIRPLSGSEAELLYVPDRLLPDTDPTGRFTMAGFGIFIEHLDIAARGMGKMIAVKRLTDLLDHTKRHPQPFARLTLSVTDQPVTVDRELLKMRRTSRLPYDGRPVPHEVLDELADIAKHYRHVFTFSQERELITWVLALNRDTLFYDMADEKARKEVGGWIRYSDREAHQKNDGFWYYCMGFPGWLLWLFIHIRWIFELPLIKSAVRTIYLRTTDGTTTIGWLQGPFTGPDDWVNAGRMLARLWLTMTKHGIYLHPFGSIITNEQSHRRLKEKFGTDETDTVMWLIVRLGYSAVPPRSLRITTDDILIS